ncbi:MAG: hypothetical protein WAZ09_02385 [Leptotrichiaceae bacterium]
MNNYELIFRKYGGVTTIVLLLISVLSFAIIINKIRQLYRNKIIHEVQ